MLEVKWASVTRLIHAVGNLEMTPNPLKTVAYPRKIIYPAILQKNIEEQLEKHNEELPSSQNCNPSISKSKMYKST